MTRIWPSDIIAAHLPDHDVTQEIFDDQGQLILHSDQHLLGGNSDPHNYRLLHEIDTTDKAITEYIGQALK
jgi:hypothetical protein